MLLFLRLLLLLLVFDTLSSTYNGGGQKQPQLNSILLLADAAALGDANLFYGNYCSSDTFPPPLSFASASPYDTNLVSLKSNLATSSASRRFSSIVSGTEQYVYGMYQCFSYLTLSQCSSCVATATNTATKNCPQSVTARIELDGCSFLYQNISINSSSSSRLVAGFVSGSVNHDSTFLASRTAVLLNVSTSAPYAPNRYSSASLGDMIYAVAQCHEYVTQDECLQCLGNATDTGGFGLGNDTGARIILGSCIFRYESNPFYTDIEEAPPTAPSSSPSPSPLIPSSDNAPPAIPSSDTSPPAARTISSEGANNRLPLVLGVVVGCAVLLGVMLCLICYIRGKRKSPSNPSQDEGAADFIELQESLHQHQIQLFSSHQMKSATKNFHDDNKLGQGGFGAVYKGTLQDGQVVAIKRLTHPSSQGKRQFLSEVETITSVQHRNLIRLLGCCVEGLDRLLVYEYLENQSLDRHIFDIADEQTALAWTTRRKNIIGTAKGLAYLHHESHLRIVHRDIKAANILLDDNLDPKIADFGLARLFSLDQTHVSTQIAGTIGYLAPEYATNGQLTEKSDIYSFGIVILEILSGRRVIDAQVPLEQQGLLSWTWRLYEEGRQLELVDPFLLKKADYVEEEANRMIYVALLCTQSLAALRPAMARVVALLEDTNNELCEVLEAPAKPILNTFNMSKLWQLSGESSPDTNISAAAAAATSATAPTTTMTTSPSTASAISTCNSLGSLKGCESISTVIVPR
ncbi:hypothetical protein L7F22_059193 [Adiantum nelumboides]|nr:hypothetical protein [Adiantum nelumboides]